MKLSKMSLAMLAAAGLLSLAPSLCAQDPAAPTTPPARRAGPRMSAEEQLKTMTEKLKLTPEQQPKVKAVLEERTKVMQEARDLSPEERKTKVTAMREKTTKEMKEILTADQFKQYEEMQKQMGSGARRNAGTNAPAAGEGKKKKAE